MSHYEERLQGDLEAIRATVGRLGERVQRALDSALRALLTADRELAYDTILRDQVVNRETRELERQCHTFVARHSPSAGHLRYVSSVLQLNIALERIGDYAVTIARESAQLSAVPPGPARRDLDLFAHQARQALGQALESFLAVDADLGRATKEMASPLTRTYDKAFEDLLEEGERGTRPLRDLFGLLIVFNRLGRVADQAKNICEEAIFAATGETKPRKRFKLLFVDRDAGLRGIVASAVGRGEHMDGLEFDVACPDPEGPVPGSLVSFLNARGRPIPEIGRLSLRSAVTLLRNFQIVVNLGLEEAQLPAIPYHTILLDWTDAEAGLDLPSATEADLERLCREYGSRLEQLVEIVRGAA